MGEKKEFKPSWEKDAASFFLDYVIGSVYENILISKCKVDNSVANYENYAKELPKVEPYLTEQENKLVSCMNIVDSIFNDEDDAKASLNRLIESWFEKAKEEWFSKNEKAHKKEFEEFLRKTISEDMDEFFKIFDLTSEDLKKHHEMVGEFVREKFRKSINPKYSKKEEDEKSRAFKEKLIKYFDKQFTQCEFEIESSVDQCEIVACAMARLADNVSDMSQTELIFNDRHPVDIASDLSFSHDFAINRLKGNFDKNDRNGYFGKFIVANSDKLQSQEDIGHIQGLVFNKLVFLPERSNEIINECKDGIIDNCYSKDANFDEMVDYLFTEAIPGVSAVVPEFIMSSFSDVFEEIAEKNPELIKTHDDEANSIIQESNSADKKADSAEHIEN